MTRLMGDAIHDQVPALAQVPGLQLVAGYDSGSPDIDWTAADWVRFPGLPQVHIDQAFNTTVNIQAHAIVFDVEPGAYQPSQAGSLINQNVTPRPTVYCDRAQLAATVASALTSSRFKGDVWLALPGWQPGQPLPALPANCQFVAVQNDFTNPNYDLSVVLDPYWPVEAPVALSYEEGWRPCTKCSGLFNIVNGPAFGWGNVCPAGGAHLSGTSGTVNTYAQTITGTTAAGS